MPMPRQAEGCGVSRLDGSQGEANVSGAAAGTRPPRSTASLQKPDLFGEFGQTALHFGVFVVVLEGLELSVQ